MKAVFDMKWLILIHVLAAILGFGPTFVFPLLLRNTSSLEEMKQNLRLVARLEMFPKIFGTLALVSGLVLFWLGSYGTFLQIWLLGTLLVFIVIEVLIVGFLSPTVKKLEASMANREAAAASEALEAPSPQLAGLYGRVRNLHAWATVLGTVILILMILKPR